MLRGLGSILVAMASLGCLGRTPDPTFLLEVAEAPMNLGATVNGPAFDGGPTLSSDGLMLYFASDRSGGRGGSDLWSLAARLSTCRSERRRTSTAA
jgi:hypothetical protein